MKPAADPQAASCGQPAPGRAQSSVRVIPVPDQGISAVVGTGVGGPFPRHAHRCLVLGLVDQGLRLVLMHGRETPVRAGELFVIPPGQGHACRAAGKAHSYRLLCLPAGVRPDLAAGGGPRLACAQAARALDHFFGLLPPKPATLARREAALPALLDLAARALGTGDSSPQEAGATPGHHGVRRAARAIARDPAAPHSLDDLARVAGLSKFHLQRLFVSGTGMSPADFRLHCRMRLALDLLDQGAGLADTALACGFADQSHFTKAFSRAVGAPPGRFVRDNPPRACTAQDKNT